MISKRLTRARGDGWSDHGSAGRLENGSPVPMSAQNFYVQTVHDSFDELFRQSDMGCDVIITDPPYSAHVQSNLCSGSLVGTKSVPKYELPFEALADYGWLANGLRISKRWVISFCDLEAFGLIVPGGENL